MIVDLKFSLILSNKIFGRIKITPQGHHIYILFSLFNSMTPLKSKITLNYLIESAIHKQIIEIIIIFVSSFEH